MPDPVFVQPHFDDVALSCGGTVAAFARTDAPKIITVFGGNPGSIDSEFVRFQHKRWQLPDADVIRSRREEDRAAARELGSEVSVVWLDYLDAIYRRPEYASDDTLFGRLVADDRSLAQLIAGDLSSYGELLVVPLGIGNHVDHQLVFEAGRVLAAEGFDVWCYPDLPYALDAAAYRRRLEELGDPEPCVCPIDAGIFERRWNAIECYKSQLPVIFRAIENPREAVEQFGRRDRDQSAVELFWNMDDIELGQR